MLMDVVANERIGNYLRKSTIPSLIYEDTFLEDTHTL